MHNQQQRLKIIQFIQAWDSHSTEYKDKSFWVWYSVIWYNSPPPHPLWHFDLITSHSNPFGVSWSHSLDTPSSVGFPWTSDQPDAETSTWQHATLKRVKYLCPAGIRTNNPSMRPAAGPRLRPHGRYDQQSETYISSLVHTSRYSIATVNLSWFLGAAYSSKRRYVPITLHGFLS